MDDNERLEHLNYFRQQILVTAMCQFAEKMEALKTADLQAFRDATAEIANMALARLIVERKLPTKLKELDSELLDDARFLVCQALNALMPFDYPYAFALLETKKPSKLEPFIICREQIPDWRDWVSRGNVPKFVTESDKDFANDKFQYEKTFTPDGQGGFIDPAITDPEGLELKEPN